MTPDVPPPDRDAGSLRLLRLLDLLAADGHRITLVARSGFDQLPAVRAVEALGVEVHPVDAARLSVPVTGPVLDLEAVIARVRPDVAWLTFYDTAEVYLPLLRALSPATRVVVDTVDVHSVREARAAALSRDPADVARAEQTRAREAAIYAAADALVAVTADDAAALAALAPDVPATVIGTVHAPAPSGPPRAARDGALFVGNFRHTPNIDAALWLARDIWPRVRAVVPDARLTLVGTAAPAEVLALDSAADGIAVAGWVPEVEPYLGAAAVSVAPLRFGAGVKGKIGEALAHGVPVVTTPIGAEGMDLTDGEHALVAETAQDFAAAVVRVLTDEALWTTLAIGGRDALASRLGPAVAHAGLRALLATTTYLAGDDLATSLRGYLAAFAPDDPVTLAVPLAPDANPDALYAELLAHVTALGHDPEHIPDVAVHHWPVGAVTPANALPAGTLAAAEPGAETQQPRAALILRLPLDPTEAAEQLDAVRASGVPAGVELLVCAADGQDVPADHVVRHAPDAGRRAVLGRAVRATQAPVIIAVEPHVLPEPGFAEPLIAAVAAGAALAGPLVDGAAGLRVARDGALWPITDGRVPDALPLDVLAAARGTFLNLPATLPSREGHAETQLAAHVGSVTVMPESKVRRAPFPDATVVVCTRDRHDILEDVVELVVGQGAAELLIVDNGSTDQTPALARALAERHPHTVRVVDEPAAGLSRARNAGARAARHDLLIYLDDDARPAPGWLPAFARELARDGVAGAGGPIVGLWPAERTPAWPEPGLEALYGVLDEGDAVRTLVPPEIVYGGNWGIRRDALDAVGGFDPDLGVAPGVRIGGEEASVAWRLQRAGLGVTRYVPAAAVGHLIGAHRLTDRFLAERALTCGLERPRHLADPDRDTLLQTANAAAARLHRAAPMTGTARLEDVLDAVVVADAPQRTKTLAADALGELAACVLLLGEREVSLGDLTLQLRPEHLDGLLDPAVAA